ncbi:hypothetical protein CWI75_16510 [Kineobactrum sediminis]|uniref:PEP-CTERM protein-sorting domain-containing protein n=1 Tax=Kineobactrum sediminis TaxID=1905677 RepID=A0A2N5XYL6_9GAMM|nr:PEP-CTERM sorting domain-containing protein [Kineobactrum sediminis]PLW81236.1 hypothetical protein CWI75_16510 [Kineobactrum sediminis]
MKATQIVFAILITTFVSVSHAGLMTLVEQVEIKIGEFGGGANCVAEYVGVSANETCSQDYNFSWPLFPASQSIERIRVFAEHSYKDSLNLKGTDDDYGIDGCEGLLTYWPGDCELDATGLASWFTSLDLRLGGDSVWDFEKSGFRSVRCENAASRDTYGRCEGVSEILSSSYTQLGPFSVSDSPISKNFQLRYRDQWSGSLFGTSDDEWDFYRYVSGTFRLFVEYDVTVIPVIPVTVIPVTVAPVPPAPSAVPTPASGLLLLTGLAGIIGLKRWKKCAA